MFSVFKFCYKYIFQVLKKLDKKFNAYISTFYVLTNLFYRKQIFCISYVKKTKIGVKKSCLCNVSFFFFTQATQIIRFLQNLVCAHRKYGVSANFHSDFLTFSQYLFEHGRICSHVPT
jgi:hypothetical protein